MHKPFEVLVEHYGPNGKGSLKLCDSPVHRHQLSPDTQCPKCHGAGDYLDTDNPFFKALWGVGPPTFKAHDYIPRSRAEAACRLWIAAKPIMRANDWILRPSEAGWSLYRPVYHKGATPEDALSAALLSVEGVKANA